MRRRSFLACVGAACGLAGCSADGRDDAPRSTVTPAPVPTDEATPEAGGPADLSPLDVEDAFEFGERHWRTLADGAHGFTREAAVREDGEAIRSMRVAVRARTGADAYHFVFDAEDTERYPTRPADAYFEVWDDGTTYHRVGREEPEYAVSEGRLFGAPSAETTQRERVRLLFGAFTTGEFARVDDRFAFRGSGLRESHDVTPARFRVLSDPRRAGLHATVATEPLRVVEYDLSLDASVSGRPVEVTSSVDFRRPAAPPEPPSWVETALEEGT